MVLTPALFQTPPTNTHILFIFSCISTVNRTLAHSSGQSRDCNVPLSQYSLHSTFIHTVPPLLTAIRFLVKVTVTVTIDPAVILLLSSSSRTAKTERDKVKQAAVQSAESDGSEDQPCSLISMVMWGKLPRTAMTSSYFSSPKKRSMVRLSESLRLTRSCRVLTLHWRGGQTSHRQLGQQHHWLIFNIFCVLVDTHTHTKSAVTFFELQ